MVIRIESDYVALEADDACAQVPDDGTWRVLEDHPHSDLCHQQVGPGDSPFVLTCMRPWGHDGDCDPFAVTESSGTDEVYL